MDQIGATCFAERCFTNCDSHHFDMIKSNDIYTSEQKNCYSLSSDHIWIHNVIRAYDKAPTS